MYYDIQYDMMKIKVSTCVKTRKLGGEVPSTIEVDLFRNSICTPKKTRSTVSTGTRWNAPFVLFIFQKENFLTCGVTHVGCNRSPSLEATSKTVQ